MKHLYCALCAGSNEIGSFLSIVWKLLLVNTGSHRLSGSEFQTVGPATEKARRPKVLSH